MILYVMRHAEAVERSETLPDEWRYLTGKGRSSAEKMSCRIVRHGPKPRLIITSPLVRAVQTAEILAAKACRNNAVVVSQLLQPGADIGTLAEHLKECGDAGRVMVVGHEPQLGSLLSGLLGRTDSAVALKKGACVALKLSRNKPDRPASLLWYLEPGRKPVSSFRKAFPGT